MQFALNLGRDHQYVCPRTVESYQRLLREGDDHCAEIFGTVTAALVEEFLIDISRQRLDSTHVFSYMAQLTRGNLRAVTVKRFLTQVQRHDPAAHAALPAELIQRYAPAEGRIFGYGQSKADNGLQPEKVLAGTAYGGDENVTACREAGIEVISPVAGNPPASKDPAGDQSPVGKEPGQPAGGAPPVPPDQAPTSKERLEHRRAQQQTEAWKKEYAKRSGQEGVNRALNRALDRVTGIKQLVVGGKKAVSMALYLKTIGWNILKWNF